MRSWATVLRFGVVGGLTGLLHYTLLYTGVEVLHLSATVSSSVGLVPVVMFNYLMHHSWTFGGEAPHGTALTRYLLMVSGSFLLNAGVMYTGEHGLEQHYMVTQALAWVAVVLWNFSLSNIWVFRQ